MSHYGNTCTERRQRVCLECVVSGEFVFGAIHSEADCQRCHKKPMGHGSVVGPSAFAEPNHKPLMRRSSSQ